MTGPQRESAAYGERPIAVFAGRTVSPAIIGPLQTQLHEYARKNGGIKLLSVAVPHLTEVHPLHGLPSTERSACRIPEHEAVALRRDIYDGLSGRLQAVHRRLPVSREQPLTLIGMLQDMLAIHIDQAPDWFTCERRSLREELARAVSHQERDMEELRPHVSVIRFTDWGELTD